MRRRVMQRNHIFYLNLSRLKLLQKHWVRDYVLLVEIFGVKRSKAVGQLQSHENRHFVKICHWFHALTKSNSHWLKKSILACIEAFHSHINYLKFAAKKPCVNEVNFFSLRHKPAYVWSTLRVLRGLSNCCYTSQATEEIENNFYRLLNRVHLVKCRLRPCDTEFA